MLSFINLLNQGKPIKNLLKMKLALGFFGDMSDRLFNIVVYHDPELFNDLIEMRNLSVTLYQKMVEFESKLKAIPSGGSDEKQA